MIITHYREKLINSIIYFARNTNKCGKVKLMKLLYFLDFCHFKQTGKSVTGMDYYAWKMGPVPKDLFEELDDMKADLGEAINIVTYDNFKKIVPKKKFDNSYFSKREMKLLEELSYVFKDANADDMTEVSHLENEPWDKTLKTKGMLEKIDYLLAVDKKPGSLTYEEAKERMEEIGELHRALGAL